MHIDLLVDSDGEGTSRYERLRREDKAAVEVGKSASGDGALVAQGNALSAPGVEALTAPGAHRCGPCVGDPHPALAGLHMSRNAAQKHARRRAIDPFVLSDEGGVDFVVVFKMRAHSKQFGGKGACKN